eukprot:CAMPEP_0170519462 /NCGR_PEP_ID=MMETSP0209-20121228/4867_1 /TAXON_ID=665100 ORGANISM="Litonotus pictus, Strain P1" /NCGR_SAMPLE_ID=MMETSP0209 /ASSEMBLY_ACC=CAM_ASM_000301 /LENGTH=350 /DNA_ID=CAMNT_0010805347 /DNA_START=207 /DNA_END=1259 /DNA_ORIENTATION=-
MSFLDKESQSKVKLFVNKKFNLKEKKRIIKERVKDYIIDFGKHTELVKFRISDDHKLFLTTSIFNLNPYLIKSLTKVIYDKEHLELEKKDFYQFLKLLQKTYFYVSYNTIKVKLCKSLVPFDIVREEGMGEVEEADNDDDFDNKKKYEMFYKESNQVQGEGSNKRNDFSKESLIERQRQFLEEINKKEEEEFFPLKFISTVSYWGIILCQGGYFSCGFFNKDKLLEHKSDHKYVIRKKAGQRQIVKDSKKSNKNSIGAQIRRENEKKHQENIECILKVNEELLGKSDVIFLYAPGLNKNILVGGNEKALFSYKKKIVSIPFHVSRANYSHLMEVYNKLTSVVLEEEDFKI